MIKQVNTATEWYSAADSFERDAEAAERRHNFRLAGFYRKQAQKAREKAAQVARGGE